MAVNNPASSPTPATKYPSALLPLLLAAILAVLFFRSFETNEVIFSNDGPLGGLMASLNKVPDVFVGAWHDLNWIGTQSPTPALNLTSIIRLLTNPLSFSKIFAPLSLFILGLGAWFCFRQMKLAPLACVLGGLAAALSSHFLSTACWGVASQAIAIGLDFAALGLLIDDSSRCRWPKLILAGLAVGMNIMEAYDIGAIFSLYIAGFMAFQSFQSEAASAMKVGKALLRVGLVAIFATFLATEALVSLIGTQIKGVAGTEQTPEAKAARWDFATQWSMPKDEVPRILIPGLFGYRMDTPKDMAILQSWFEGGVYWGKVGETPGWSEHHNDPEWLRTHPNTPRFSGGGEYAGVLVVAVALWAVLQSLRKKDSVFSPVHRKFIWFWAAAAFISLLLAFGRYAPFYHLVYILPYFSTIRNPAKFMHPFHWSLVILFAYGMHGLCRRNLGSFGALAFGGGATTSGRSIQEAPSPQTSLAKKDKGKKQERPIPLSPGDTVGVKGTSVGLQAHLKTWWAKAGDFDKKWTRGSAIAVVVSLLGWLIYATSKSGLEQHLRDVGFGDPALAARVASFSAREVGLYLLFLILTLGLLVVVLSGWFTGHRARWGGILLGALLVVDLSRANLPWIIYWDYKDKYATNPVIDFLRDKPYEHRVTGNLPFRPPPQLSLLNEVYRIEWAQHQFQYYNIQSLDIIQMPRMTEDYVAFEGTLEFDGTPGSVSHLARRWQLTNTRYFLGATVFREALNQQLDPGRNRFQVVERFDLVPKPGLTEVQSLDQLTAVSNTNGQYAIFSFNGALPRARLYTDWQVATNDPVAVNQLQAATNANDLELLKKVGTNDFLTLKKLASSQFDPEKTVLLAAPLSSPSSALTASNAPGGTVDFVSYAPKYVVLHAKAAAPSVLLLNDKYDSNWKVTLDGKPERLLRCNYIMRGIQVPAGDHRIEFRFQPPITGLYVSVAAIALGLGLIGFLAVASRAEKHPTPAAAEEKPVAAKQ
jgi:hypothetical protein